MCIRARFYSLNFNLVTMYWGTDGSMGIEHKRRVEAYISNVEQALENIKVIDEKARQIVELARNYLDDSRYYLEKGDVFTSLACIAYAEGLLDTLARLGLVELSWKPLSSLMSRPRVLVAGTFEIIHPGHIELLHKAWEKGRVYVIVSRDVNAEKFKKRKIIIPEDQRLNVVSAIKYVHKAILGDENDILKPLEVIKPDIILLGPDQGVNEDWLKQELRKRGINAKVERLESKVECPLCSTSKIIEKIANMKCREN